MAFIHDLSLFSELLEEVSSKTLVQRVLSVISSVSNNCSSCLRSPFSEVVTFRFANKRYFRNFLRVSKCGKTTQNRYAKK